MRLSELAAQLPDVSLRGDGDPTITSVSYDSRSASPGSIFVAVPGFRTDGHDYLEQALADGASAVAVQADREAKWRPILSNGPTEALILPDTRAALAQIASALLGHPARRLRTIGVTGTDGKTSLCHLLHHVISSAGEKTGLISTAECRVDDDLLPDTGRFTTPEAPEVQQMLVQMVEADCRYAVIEASSHGLALNRVDECDFDVGVFTNLYPDHLDFHQTLEDYIAAKGRLFSMLDTAAQKDIEKTAVLNADEPTSEQFRRLTTARIIAYGLHSDADVTAENIVPEGWGTRFHIRAFGEEREVRISTPGDFNVYNALAAYSVAHADGLDLDATIEALQNWPGAPGRMERVDAGQPFTILVDFAHAPDSLKRVLRMLRERSKGRIIAVFGCIGERDKDRRYRMGQVAAEGADYTIVTDDNPYSEDRDSIIEEIARGLREAGKREGHDFAVIPDRREAIAHALAMAVDGDAILLAGKGHEREVHLPDSTYPCHDPTVAREVLRDLGYSH
ncbi:MAG TPA: UDP-N-acetylmuramoyl-L-alanyl-D-glutamate--2,6-diaminopimelate ligase [Dehalococcoidia bacterium]|jgi:UDP-N-acetylmuramoyl-L-alanyl-D-glutamate--2,6-diaminopimelate ligase|nr:UDP-N-acetylmuramoyl-L-alanyl-D-glutamate--2,6-diaminopimelate ligase [Dehalococcoidia bacterium]